VCASVVAHGDTPPVLEFCKHVFDFMALFVEDGIVRDKGFSVFLGWNAGRDAFFFQYLPEPVGIIAPVCEQFFGLRQSVE